MLFCLCKGEKNKYIYITKSIIIIRIAICIYNKIYWFEIYIVLIGFIIIS
jgi:hypothetical protein